MNKKRSKIIRKGNKIIIDGFEYDKDSLHEEALRSLEHYEKGTKELEANSYSHRWRNLTTTQKIANIIFLLGIFIFTASMFYSVFTRVSVTADISEELKLISPGFILAFTWSGLYILIKDSSIQFKKKKIGQSLQLLFGLLLLPCLGYYAILSAVPAALHHLTSTDGSVKLTVSTKRSGYSRYECSPGLVMQEFKGFNPKPICPGRSVYDRINVGDTVEVYGKVSPYGVQASYVRIVDKAD